VPFSLLQTCLYEECMMCLMCLSCWHCLMLADYKGLDDLE
jgi:hypothetical protein